MQPPYGCKCYCRLTKCILRPLSGCKLSSQSYNFQNQWQGVEAPILVPISTSCCRPPPWPRSLTPSPMPPFTTVAVAVSAPSTSRTRRFCAAYSSVLLGFLVMVDQFAVWAEQHLSMFYVHLLFCSHFLNSI